MNIPPKPTSSHRYVPTLTEVVHADDLGTRSRNVPDVVDKHLTSDSGPAVPGPKERDVSLAAVREKQGAVRAPAMEEQIIHRVMQRIDVSLDYRLRRCVSDVMIEQTQLILTRLREEVEKVVRDSVHQAVAEELANGRESTSIHIKNLR